MQPNQLSAIQRNLCELWEAKSGMVIPQNAKALGMPSGRIYEAGHRLAKKEAGESLYLYRSRYCFQLDGLQVTSWVTEQWPNGAIAWCEIELEIEDPVALFAEFGEDSSRSNDVQLLATTVIKEWIRPRITELLDRLGDRGQLTSEAYWSEIASQMCKELRLPAGFSIARFDLRKVRTLDQFLTEQRLKEECRTKLQEAIDDGTLKRLASQGRVEEFVKGLETEHSTEILTAVERHQDAIERLATYIELCGVNRERFDQQVAALHQESFSIQKQLADVTVRITDMMELIVPSEEKKKSNMSNSNEDYRIQINSLSGDVQRVGDDYQYRIVIEAINLSKLPLNLSGLTINVPTIDSIDIYNSIELRTSSNGCKTPFYREPGRDIWGFLDDGTFGEMPAECLLIECVLKKWKQNDRISMEAIIVAPFSRLDVHARVWSTRPTSDGGSEGFFEPDWHATIEHDQQGIPASLLSIGFD